MAAKGYLVPYSQDIYRYLPLCRSCHTKRDGNRKIDYWIRRCLEVEAWVAEHMRNPQVQCLQVPYEPRPFV